MCMQVLGKTFHSVSSQIKHGLNLNMFGFMPGLKFLPTDLDRLKITSVWALDLGSEKTTTNTGVKR